MRAILILVGVLLLQGCGFLLEDKETFNLGTPEQALDWISTHITYKADVVNRWQLPSETLRLGTGDCEDFAILFMSALRAQGITSKLVGIKVDWYPPSDSNNKHAVTQWGDEWYSPQMGDKGGIPIGIYPKMWEATFQECLSHAYRDNQEGNY